MRRIITGTTCLLLTLMCLGSASAQEKSITVGWAAWDPANALMELSKDFTKKTGIQVHGEFIPWPQFQQKVFTVLNSHGDTFDVLIGDSQWIGSGAEYGHYVELSQFFKNNGIDLKKDFAAGPVHYYAQWPKGSDHYWGLPTEGDAVGWTYRKDWFAKPELKKAFKQKYGYELAPPKTWKQLKDIGEFFQGRTIDGKKVYGMAIYTKRPGDGISQGVLSAMWSWGVSMHAPDDPYDLQGYFNSDEAVDALKFYKSLYDCCVPPGSGDNYMEADLDAYTSGQVAMAMNFFAFFPGISRNPNVGDVTGYFVTPGHDGHHGTQLGGQGMSVVSYSNKKKWAKEYVKWFSQPEVQKKWWELGGYSTRKSVLNDPGFDDSEPYAKAFKESMKIVKDFWETPNYGELLDTAQRHFNQYIVGGQGTAKEALDAIVRDWHDSFEALGKYDN
ncbi:MAG TPA: extracellular solute-binding protein [Gammaproteobacteria bacterium]|nr:extracellular solute-binding protein [Gammaproteobacteria bacterium]